MAGPLKRFLLMSLCCLSLSLAAQDGYADAEVDTTFAADPAIRLPQGDAPFHAVDPDSLEARHFRHGLAEDYKGPAYQYEPQKTEKSLWERFARWLGRKIGDWFAIEDAATAVSIVGWIGRVLLILAVLAIVYLIAQLLLNKQGRWIFGRDNRSLVHIEDAVLSMQPEDFEHRIAEAIALKDHRLAIRYYYLLLLRSLTRRGLIEFDREKTNSDYRYEIRDARLAERFGYLSYLYDYIWYGQFEADEALFARTQADFRSTIASLS